MKRTTIGAATVSAAFILAGSAIVWIHYVHVRKHKADLAYYQDQGWEIAMKGTNLPDQIRDETDQFDLQLKENAAEVHREIAMRSSKEELIAMQARQRIDLLKQIRKVIELRQEQAMVAQELVVNDEAELREEQWLKYDSSSTEKEITKVKKAVEACEYALKAMQKVETTIEGTP
jgi:actin-related protein